MCSLQQIQGPRLCSQCNVCWSLLEQYSQRLHVCTAGSFTSARSVVHSAAGDKEEPVFDPPGRVDSFVSARSFGQASSASAESFMTAKSGTRVCSAAEHASLHRSHSSAVWLFLSRLQRSVCK